MKYLLILLLCIVPVVIGFRVRKAGAFVLYNPFFYLVVFSYFYLLVPSILSAESPISDFLGLDRESFDRVSLFSAWFVVVFLGAYSISNDYVVELRNDFLVPKLTIRLASFVLLFTVSISIYVLVLHGPSLYGLSSSRFDSYEYYRINILVPYAFQLVFQMTAVCASLLALHNRNLRFFMLLTPFLILDFLQGGRAVTFMTSVSFCLVAVLIHPNGGKKILGFVSSFIFVLFLSAFFRRALPGSGVDIEAQLIEMFGEFYFTRLTAQYVYVYSLSAGDFLDFIVLVMSKLIPQFLVNAISDIGSIIRYDVELNETVDVGFGLAGSVLAEAFYYGGEWFAWVSPFFISASYFVLYRFKIICKLPGFVFFLLLVGSSFSIFRSAFFLSFTALIYTFLFYFSFIVLTSWDTKLLKVSRI